MTSAAMRGVRRRFPATLAVAAMAMAAVLATPEPGALTLDAVTTGPLFRAADAAGFDSVTFDVATLGSITIELQYGGSLLASSPKTLADAINAYPFGGPLAVEYRRQPGGSLGGAILAGAGIGAYNAGLAYEALRSSAGGNTLPGYTPLVPGPRTCVFQACVQFSNVTNLVVLEVNNPASPNGGFFSRFAPIFRLFGIQPVSATGTSVRSTGIALNAAVIGAALGYNAWSDFPATLNPFALANTLLATALPTSLLGGYTIKGASPQTLGANLAELLSFSVASTAYSTFVPNDLPLLEPLRLPSRVVNQIFQAIGIPLSLGTPLADALEPVLSILVNTGYTDVKTPAEGGTYNRTYDQSGSFVPYLSQAPLTPAEWLQVPGDLVRALIVGFQDSFPILRFGKTAPVLTVDGNHLAITHPVPLAQATASPRAAPPRLQRARPAASPGTGTSARGVRTASVAHRAAGG